MEEDIEKYLAFEPGFGGDGLHACFLLLPQNCWSYRKDGPWTEIAA